MSQVIQIIGSLLILVPFVLAQAGRTTTSSRVYIASNFAGSSILAVDALHGHQWGFLLLEGVWAIVSFVALVRPRRSAGAA